MNNINFILKKIKNKIIKILYGQGTNIIKEMTLKKNKLLPESFKKVI